MIDVEMIFRYKKANFEKLLANGFVYCDGMYTKSFLILGEQFRLELAIDKDGHIRVRLTVCIKICLSLSVRMKNMC